jgi:hypothetical protein
MSNLVDHAERELKLAGLYDADADYGGEVAKCVMELITAFAKQGHSGGSGAALMTLFSRLARFEPLTPITSDPAEWNDVSAVSDERMWQSRRCPSVFCDDQGTVWDIECAVYVWPDGSATTRGRNDYSRVKLPYMPGQKRTIVVDRDGVPICKAEEIAK